MCKANETLLPHPSPHKTTHACKHGYMHMRWLFRKREEPFNLGEFQLVWNTDLNKTNVKYFSSCLKIRLMKKKNKISIMSWNCKQSLTHRRAPLISVKWESLEKLRAVFILQTFGDFKYQANVLTYNIYLKVTPLSHSCILLGWRYSIGMTLSCTYNFHSGCLLWT